jgi:hypothetical protein
LVDGVRVGKGLEDGPKDPLGCPARSACLRDKAARLQGKTRFAFQEDTQYNSARTYSVTKFAAV